MQEHCNFDRIRPYDNDNDNDPDSPNYHDPDPDRDRNVSPRRFILSNRKGPIEP